ncbi:MAG TPA: serine hydrolase domain-containing protein [Candidatus Aquilonibacter sp.]
MLTGLALGALLAVTAPVTPAPLTHVFSATMEHQIDDLGRHAVQSGRTPGLAIGIVEDGRIVYAHGFGESNRETHARFAPTTQTSIGAVSMQFTAAALLLLAQDGKLKLDDAVTRYVPDLRVAKGVTVRELLNQTSCLPDPSAARDIDTDRTKSIKLDQLIAAADTQAAICAPGTQFHFNPFNYMIAGRIVERASDVPLSDYLQQHIFIPLVMNQTFLAGDNGISRRHAVGYTKNGASFARTKPWDPAWLYGGQSVVTDVYDLAKWDIGLPLLLRVDAERDMFTASGAPGPQRYGLGWVIDERNGEPYVWANGEVAGFHAMNALVPLQHVAVIVLANTDDAHGSTIVPESIAGEILDIVLPPARAHLDNAIVARAKDWLTRIADKNIDRTQLTPAFSRYLTDGLVAKTNLAALGRPLDFVPIASRATSDGGTVYEFLVRFAHEQYHYRFGIAKDGKIDEIFLVR